MVYGRCNGCNDQHTTAQRAIGHGIILKCLDIASCPEAYSQVGEQEEPEGQLAGGDEI